MSLSIEKIKANHCCVGCGICESAFDDCVVKLDENGYYDLNYGNENIDQQFSKLCPVVNNTYITTEIWGNMVSSYYGYSTDHTIRYEGSSGGVLTSIARHLLETKKVEAVIQVRASITDPIINEVVVSKTVDEVLQCAGSRYAPVKMLSHINDLLEIGKTYCFIGKPCDVRALNNYFELYPKKKEQVPYKLSFFCAGVPSLNATKEILEEFANNSTLKKFDYRGNGWPGFTTASYEDGTINKMHYNDSWGKILGRSLHTGCRFCVDGVGMGADISCGDAWYCDEKGYPLFDEAEGRNVILVRSHKGETVIKEMVLKEKLVAKPLDHVESELRNIQPYQYKRKAMMYTKIKILKLCGKYTPTYGSVLRKWNRQIPHSEKISYASGTLKRILKKRI